MIQTCHSSTTPIIKQILFYLIAIFCSSIASLPIFILITIQGCCQEEKKWITIRYPTTKVRAFIHDCKIWTLVIMIYSLKKEGRQVQMLHQTFRSVSLAKSNFQCQTRWFSPFNLLYEDSMYLKFTLNVKATKRKIWLLFKSKIGN